MARPPATGPSCPVRVGLIGYGLGGASFHAPFIHATTDLELAAIVTRDPARQAMARERYPATAIAADVDELLGRDDLDVVVVSTPNSTHVPVATEVLRTGRHVVVDKPIAPTADEARALRAVAETHGAHCIPFHNRRWDGDFRTVRELVEQGRLGVLSRLEIRWERWRPVVTANPARAWKDDPTPGAGGGVLFDLGPHVIDQALVLMGRPTSVYAELATRRPEGRSADDAFVALRFPSGGVAHLTTSLVVGQPLPRFRAVGEDATYLGVTTMDPQEDALGAGRTPDEADWGAVEESAWGTLGAGAEREPIPTRRGDYGAFYRGVAETVLTGTPPPVTVDDGIAVAEVLDAAVRSAAEGRSVPLDG